MQAPRLTQGPVCECELLPLPPLQVKSPTVQLYVDLETLVQQLAKPTRLTGICRNSKFGDIHV